MRWLLNLFFDSGESSLSAMWRRMKANRRERRVDAQIEAQRVAQVRQDAGVDQVESRVSSVEQQVQEVRPTLEALEAARQEREESRRREAERAQLGHEAH